LKAKRDPGACSGICVVGLSVGVVREDSDERVREKAKTSFCEQKEAKKLY
jgi:hypothetical protein